MLHLNSFSIVLSAENRVSAGLEKFLNALNSVLSKKKKGLKIY